MLISTIIGAIVNIVLNLVLVFSFKQNGVAIASVITEFCVVFYQMVVARKSVHIEIKRSFVMSVIFGTICMFLSVELCKWAVDNSVGCLLVSVITGSIVYYLITLITKK